MQLIFRYGFFKLQYIPVALALADWQYILLVLSTLCIAAGGYVINNIHDQATDIHNKPEDVIVGKSISEANAYNIYVGLNIIGVGIGFYLANVIERPNFASVFIIIAATLYMYATSFKQSLLIGNVIVALLTTTSVIIVGIFDLLPATSDDNRSLMTLLFSILLDYAIFTFLINFIREIVKDLQDVDGDYNQGMNTLPIAIGIDRTKKIVFGFTFIPLLTLLWYINNYIFTNNLLITTIYGLIFIVCPLIYFMAKILSAKTPQEFKHLSLVLKALLFFGILSVLFISIEMKQHV